MIKLRIVTGGVLALAGVVAGLSMHTEAAAAPTIGAVAARSVTTPITKDQVVATVSQMPAIARRVDKLEARLTTYGELLAAASPGTKVAWPAPDTLVWAVAVAGQVSPSAAHGRAFPWAVFVYDATNGKFIATAGHDKGTWPPYFATLTDLAR